VRCRKKTSAAANLTQHFARLRSALRSAHTGWKVPAIALASVNSFSVGGRGPTPSAAASAFQAMYGESGDSIMHATGEETFEAVKMLRDANPAQYKPAAGIEYPTTNSATT